MFIMKLYDFIVTTKLKNVSDSNIYSDTNFETTDLIYIQSKEDIVDHVNNGLTTRCSATDFAKLNGIMTNYSADFLMVQPIFLVVISFVQNQPMAFMKGNLLKK